MGRESRLNPRSPDSGRSQREVLVARIQRFCDFFDTRQDFEDYLASRDITEQERAYLESHLPARLQHSCVLVES
jgi:hypothetical protein